MPLVLLTTVMTVLVVLAGWESVQYRPAQYLAAFLIQEGLMVGAFSALDSIPRCCPRTCTCRSGTGA